MNGPMDPMVATFDPMSFDVLMKRGHEEHTHKTYTQQSTKKSRKHRRVRKTKHGKKPTLPLDGKHFPQQRRGRTLAQMPFDMESIDMASLGKLSHTPLPVGLKFPKDLSLEQLQKIINDFHKNETRTDVLTQLPMDFEPQKSIFSFLYTMNTFKDPSIDLAGCPVAVTPSGPDDTASGLVWECEAGNFCAVPNVSVPCLPGFYCPANTAQPTLCCKGYLCSPDTKTIEVCPEGFFCPIASTKALPCNFLAYCPPGTTAIEKYGVGAILFVFALMVTGIFAIKKRIFRAQRLRYRQRLRDLGDNSEDVENEKRRDKEAAMLAQSIILDPSASHRSLALAVVRASNANASTMTLPKAERSFDIRFEKLGLTLPTGVDIIKNISGRLLTGRTCAVMGPSGAGKTTFLSILAGKVAKTDGSIKVNGKEQTLSLWKKLIGFVPQEDVMLSDLTVREILMHPARMRQPVHMSLSEKRLKVLEAIKFLGIGHIMDNPIGDVETRGISGGERKRINIDQSLTVAAVVHSPSPHAFNQFDDLLLLGAGGRVVYSGPRDEAAHYFESIGYPVPGDENPADFFISIAAGRVDKLPTLHDQNNIGERRRNSKIKSSKERISDLFNQREEYHKNMELAKTLGDPRMSKGETMTTVQLTSCQGSPIKRDSMKQSSLYPDEHDEFKPTGRPFEFNAPGTMIVGSLRWRYINHLDLNRPHVADESLHWLWSIKSRQPAEICAMAPPSIQLSCATPVDDIRYVGMFMALGVFFAGINVGACTFGDEKAVFWRDTSAGMPTLPYYLAKVLADVPRIIVASCMYAGVFIFFFAYHEQLSSLLLLILLLYINAFAMVMNSSGYASVRWVWNVSAPRWAVEAFYLKEMESRNYNEIKHNLLGDTYSFANYERAILYMLYISLGWNIVSFALMKLLNRHKVK
ncbi:MAG: hypothetical protein J3Q66DRAFT_435206 [Benniella sp.]|nr:MAG: hypothetical protein J3Q66DRAFT_435206 [Benniella sp.]